MVLVRKAGGRKRWCRSRVCVFMKSLCFYKFQYYFCIVFMCFLYCFHVFLFCGFCFYVFLLHGDFCFDCRFVPRCIFLLPWSGMWAPHCGFKNRADPAKALPDSMTSCFTSLPLWPHCKCYPGVSCDLPSPVFAHRFRFRRRYGGVRKGLHEGHRRAMCFVHQWNRE